MMKHVRSRSTGLFLSMLQPSDAKAKFNAGADKVIMTLNLILLTRAISLGP